ncbi:MAG TPA: DUF362 domain-containing protein [Bacteroidales bacterium]|nr:DUF362 domain-containing protein [Bacteroidales bacterium]
MGKSLNRRRFFTLLGAGGASLAARPLLAMGTAENQEQAKPATNISDAAKTARKPGSMPGRFPGKVVIARDPNSVIDDVPVESVAYAMIAKSMLELTGAARTEDAWRLFVSPGEKIGLKVNPVAGRLLSTSHAVVQSVVRQLTESGIDRKDILIWDRRDMELKDTGFTAENYPGITIRGTECQDSGGSFTDENGKLYGERNIDKEWYYWADVEGEYDAETMPYMINGGKYSYFTKIVTREVDKIINIPVLKNAGASITNAMKNLAFGSVTNTGRLHASLWNETCAEVCAFSPLRDKVVLNISDGLRGCFNGGPGASPQFICNYNTILVSSDPVAMDRIAYDIVAAKRIEEGIQREPTPGVLSFLSMASSLGLGIADKERIDLRIV